MSTDYDSIKNEQRGLESLGKKILPGYKGYKEKEQRREADSLLRGALVRDFTTQLDRLSPIQETIMGNGGIEWMSEVGAVKTALQTLIDRIRNAPQGYAGFFDAVKVKEDDLDRLQAFDQQLVGEIVKVSAGFDALQKAADDNIEVKGAIAAAHKIVKEAADLFNKRGSVITGI